MTLDQVEFDKDIVFSGFLDEDDIYLSKLAALGLIQGATCRLLKKITSCGVLQLQVRDSVLGLRLKEAKRLIFEYK